MPITLDQAETKLTEYTAAETAVLGSQSYTIEGRTLTRADLKEIRDGITYWNDWSVRLSTNGGRRVRSMTPVTD